MQFAKDQFDTNSPAQYFKQLADAVEVLRLVDKTQKNVVNLFANERAQTEEFSVDAVQHGLQEVPFPRILRVEQLQQLKFDQNEHTEIVSVYVTTNVDTNTHL